MTRERVGVKVNVDLVGRGMPLGRDVEWETAQAEFDRLVAGRRLVSGPHRTTVVEEATQTMWLRIEGVVE